jgi:hypothetical protein
MSRDTLTLIILLGGALAALNQWVVKPLYHAAVELSQAIRFIRHEVDNNSGRTVKDLATRTDRRFEHLFKHLNIEMPDDMRTPPPKENTPT